MNSQLAAALTDPMLEWWTVPLRVQALYKQGSAMQKQVKDLAKYLPEFKRGYGYVYWNPDRKSLWLVTSDSDTPTAVARWVAALKALPDVETVRAEAEYFPDAGENWVKVAGAFRTLDMPYQWMGRATGGASPLTNSIVSGLLGGTLGYAAGTAAEHLMPEQYVERGRLRKTLAGLGAAGGALAHIPQWIANASINREATGKPHWLRSLMLGDDYQQLAPHELQHLQDLGAFQKRSDILRKTAAEINTLCGVKTADSGIRGTAAVPLRPVPVDSFNRAIWNDVHNGANSSQANQYGTRSVYSDNSEQFGTPPAHAAAAAGLVSGIQQMYGKPSLLSPRHFIHGLAAAGLDTAAATVAGGILGALGGMTPAAQRQLQQMGAWGGLIRGVTGTALGLY